MTGKGEAPDVEVRQLGDADLDAAAAVHLAAFPDSLVSRLGTEAVTRQYRWLLDGPHENPFGLIAEVDGVAAGVYLGGRYDGATTGYLRANLGFLLRTMARRPQVLFAPEYRGKIATGVRLLSRKPAAAVRSLTTRGITPSASPVAEVPSEPSTPSFAHLVVGVHPRFQGHGIGGRMMDEADRRVLGMGYTRTHLRVVPGNEAATRLYESRGYTRKVDASGAWDGAMTRSATEESSPEVER